MKIAIIFMPFAFNGPPVVESGPRAIKWYLGKVNVFGTLDVKYYDLKQEFSQSPHQHLVKLYELISTIYEDFDLIICFGGSHLSSLPLHDFMSTQENHLCIVLDAHRDYYLGDISNASFLRYIDRTHEKKGVSGIYGYRDDNELDYDLNFIYSRTEFVEFRNCIMKFLSIHSNPQCFLDIDLDVFSNKIFDQTYSIIDDGIDLEEFKQILYLFGSKHMKLFCFSEYSPYNDTDNKGVSFIIDLLELIIKTKHQQ